MLHSQGSEDRIELLSISNQLRSDPTQTWRRESQPVSPKIKYIVKAWADYSKDVSFSARAGITILLSLHFLPAAKYQWEKSHTLGLDVTQNPWASTSCGTQHAQQRTLHHHVLPNQTFAHISAGFHQFSFLKFEFLQRQSLFSLGFPTTGTLRIKVFWEGRAWWRTPVPNRLGG